MKRLPLGNICGILLIILFVGSAVIITFNDSLNRETQEIFCKENGYEYVDRGIFRVSSNFCMLLENNTLFKKEIGSCNGSKYISKDWCFIEGGK